MEWWKRLRDVLDFRADGGIGFFLIPSTHMKPCLLLGLGVSLFPSALLADLFVSNFTAINGTAGASGVWRNQTTATNLAIPVSLGQTGGTVKPVDHPTQPSRIDDSFPWSDVPPFFPNLFEPNFDGDFINIEVIGGQTATVTLNFNAQITNPSISFSDVDVDTDLTFPPTFTITAQSGNLARNGNTVAPTGASVIGLGTRGVGSIQFSGIYSQIVFTFAYGGLPTNADRTGFVAATTTPPGAAPPPAVVNLQLNGDQVMLSWPSGAFSEIQSSADLSPASWQAIPGLDAASQTSWSGSKATLGPRRFFRGVRVP